MKNRDFRISNNSRQKMIFFSPVFETKENLRRMYIQAQELSHTYNTKHQEKVSAAKLHSCAVLHLIYQTVISAYLKETDSDPFSRISVLAGKSEDCMKVLDYYGRMFPTELDDEVSEALSTEETVRAFFVHQVYQSNPAILKASQELLNQNGMSFPGGTKALKALLGSYLQGTGLTDSADEDLFSFLTRPARLFPESLEEQILYILKNWAAFLPDELRTALLRSLDYLKEENKPQNTGGSGFFTVPDYRNESDVESFSEDKSWMPNVVMMAKSTLVWLDQLSKKYRREVARLDQIPDEELDTLKNRGFTALWLIGLWQRSPASKKIKNLCGNPDAESSAYSLKGYDIADRLGGWSALNNLRARCWKRGIRLASDMVPNHTGIDSNLLYTHPEYFIQQDWPPFPSYSYTGENLSDNPDIEIKIEDHYFSRTDAAVTFMKYDRRTGQTSYIFHGNDGTTMPWNDTAQIDFLNPASREAVIQQILEVARNFPIIRFDAAMTLAKRHIQRLWYPQPGSGGDIAGRTPYGMSDEEFNRRIPNEFWREVVDRIQSEVPDTLLLAEAFWMMESYFVRTLGMHRVYNSAFMHMMKNQDNAKYRQSIKATLLFDPEILKRYVNFMNNPDEDTAIAQFGNSDKYFGVCTLLATMPGLPMFGHGQIEGFREKYGMEYQRAYWDEQADEGLVRAHERKIFPLLKMRRLFSGCRYFQLFDAEENGEVQESIFAYTNGDDTRMTLVLYNNRYEHAQGRIRSSVPKTIRTESGKETQTVTLAQSLRLSMSPRRFVIYRNFTDGLIYVAPSMKIIEDGYWVSLNGYETRVLTDIHEIEDIDGVYARLCEHLQGRGISNLELEIKLMYLQPFWNAAEGMKNQKFLKNLKSLLTGKSSQTAKKEIMQTLGTCYTYIEELEDLFAKIGLTVHRMKPAEVLDIINRIENVCREGVFTNGNVMMNEMPVILSSAMLIMPFVNSRSSMEQAMYAARTVIADRFFETDPKIIYRCCILLAGNRPVTELLSDRIFLDLIGENLYNNVRWFNGEAFQECMFLSCFASALFETETSGKPDLQSYEREIRKWLDICSRADYKLEKLVQ